MHVWEISLQQWKMLDSYKTILYFSSSTVFSVKQWEHNQIRYTIRKIELQQMFVGPVFLFNDCVEEKWITHNLTSFISLQIESTWALHKKSILCCMLSAAKEEPNSNRLIIRIMLKILSDLD